MWARLIAALVGCWILAAPRLLPMAHDAAVNHYITGPIAASFAIIAINENTRPLRWMTAVCGAWMVTAPLLLEHGTTVSVVSSVLSGILLIATALVRGELRERLGGGWRAVMSSARRG